MSDPKTEEVRCKCGAEVSAVLGRDFENIAVWRLASHYAENPDYIVKESGGMCSESGQETP